MQVLKIQQEQVCCEELFCRSIVMGALTAVQVETQLRLCLEMQPRRVLILRGKGRFKGEQPREKRRDFCIWPWGKPRKYLDTNVYDIICGSGACSFWSILAEPPGKALEVSSLGAGLDQKAPAPQKQALPIPDSKCFERKSSPQKISSH